VADGWVASSRDQTNFENRFKSIADIVQSAMVSPGASTSIIFPSLPPCRPKKQWS
jgi:hypothetical protein